MTCGLVICHDSAPYRRVLKIVFLNSLILVFVVMILIYTYFRVFFYRFQLIYGCNMLLTSMKHTLYLLSNHYAMTQTLTLSSCRGNYVDTNYTRVGQQRSIFLNPKDRHLQLSHFCLFRSPFLSESMFVLMSHNNN